MAALAAAVVVLLYATLPWWVPKGWLAGRIARQLSGQAGVTVAVDRVDLSWADGVTVHGLRIANEPAFGEGELLSVGRVRCDLVPLTMLAGKPLEWMELSEVRLRAVIDQAGRANLAPLSRIVIEPIPRRLVARDAAAILQLRGSEQQLRLDVSDVQYRAGRLSRVGRITMSAALAQDGGDAPVTLVASTSRRDPVATGSFRFARVDIAQLRLPQLLGLPLRRLRGISSGRLTCRLTSDGTVEGLLLSVRVKDLDAQPEAGPALPVIAEAEVSVSATYDWYTKNFQMDGFRLHLPGAVDMRGRGRIHSAVLTGGWEGVESLEVTGAVNPATLAALLSGGPERLPGGVSVDGQVKLNLSLRGDESQLSSSLLLDATAARLKVGGREAKPPGRKLSVRLQGSVEKRTWRFTVDRTELCLGANRFAGGGAMQNIRRLAGKWIRAEEPVTLAMVLDDLAALDWDGSWEISDLASLQELLGWAPLKQVELSGALSGDWSVKHAGRVLLRGSVRAGPEARLSVGRWFVKPAGKPLAVEASGDVATDAPRLSRLRLWGGVGESGVRIDEGKLTFATAAGGMDLRAEGRFALEDAGGVLACLPPARKWNGRLAGSAHGTFAVMLAPGFRRLHVKANAARLSAEAGDTFAKAAGQPADVVLDYCRDQALPAEKRNRLELRLGLGSAELAAAGSFPAAGAKQPRLDCSARLAVRDADWLLQRSPALARALRACDVRGAMDVSVRCTLAEAALGGEITCDATDLEFKLPATGGTKARGSALRLRLSGRTEDGRAVIDNLALDLGRSSLNLTGTVTTARAKAPPRDAYWPPPGVAGVDLTLRGRLTPDSAVRSLLPALAEPLRRCGAKGVLRMAMGIRDAGAGGLDVTGRFDASRAGFAVGEHFRKPADAPANGRFELSLPADLARVRLRDLFVDAGAFQLRANAQAPLLRAGELAAHAAVTAPDLRAVSAYVPELGRHDAAGGLFVEADYRRRGGRHLVRNATLVARGVRATVRGKTVRLDGEVKLAEAEFTRTELTAGKVVTESLEWAVGDSHGFVVADLSDLPRRPAGTVAVLCTGVDAAQLQQWASPRTEAFSSGGLTPADREALAAQADRLIARLRPILAEADLQVRFEARRLRYFDEIVRAFYVVQGVAGRAAVKRGQVSADFACGLNGGTVEYRYRLDLGQEPLRVAMQCHLDRLLAKENIILQLAQEFPGNQVFGTFTRRTEGRFGLREAVMSALDGRHRVIVAGPAETVADDGLIRGRAAPKFITRIFPGLNLATYRYRRMTAFAEYLPDGSADNDMIFQGPIYDIYIQGTTDRDHIGRYEIGVLLLGSPQSPQTLHELRQGRIPILKFKARIENGRFWDEEVTYPRPDEAAYKIFLANNIFYRLWRASRKGPRGAASVIRPTEPAAPAGGEQ